MRLRVVADIPESPLSGISATTHRRACPMAG